MWNEIFWFYPPIRCTLVHRMQKVIQPSWKPEHSYAFSYWGNPHICAQCNKSFTQTGKLKEHIFIDSDEKPHSWTTECKKSFSNSRTLGRHLLMHTGEKLHPCTECEKSLVEMEFWRTICSTTMEKSRTDAQSVRSQTRKVANRCSLCN